MLTEIWKCEWGLGVQCVLLRGHGCGHSIASYMNRNKVPIAGSRAIRYLAPSRGILNPFRDYKPHGDFGSIMWTGRDSALQIPCSYNTVQKGGKNAAK